MDAINTALMQLYEKNTYTITHLGASKTYEEMSDDEKAEVRRLKKIDAEVRAHEEAHKRAAGELARGGVHFEYKIGPDGKRYAVSGNVKIDSSEDPRGPEETIQKAEKIKLASLAPMDPSSADRQVAADAERMKNKAQQDIFEDRQEKLKVEDFIYSPEGKIYNLSEVESNFEVYA